jgi:hypothetical protein
VFPSPRLSYSELIQEFETDAASAMLDEVVRTFPTRPGACVQSSEVQMERGLVLAQELVQRLSEVSPNEHAPSSQRIRLVRAHALAIVALIEESVLRGV